jgi:(2Fe-2S) ferredoxin
MVTETSSPTKQRKRVVICRGQYCNIGRRADRLCRRLEEALDEINGDQLPKTVKLEVANCLSMCGAGPNLVIYPEGLVYNDLNDDSLADIIETYLRF